MCVAVCRCLAGYKTRRARALFDSRSACLLFRACRSCFRHAGIRNLCHQPGRAGARARLLAFEGSRRKSDRSICSNRADAGSDVAAIKTTATRDGDAYVIDGRKRFISNAGVADFYTVFARTGTDANGRAALSAFIVGAKMPGFSVVERTVMIAAHPIGEIEFKDCRVPAEDMVGAEGDGFVLAMRTMDIFRSSVGASACGMARRALDEALRYATSRKQFGRLLVEHQLIQEKLADMVTELDAARLLVYRAAH